MKMESFSLKSPAVTTIPASLTKSGFFERNSIYGQVRFSNYTKHKHARKLKILAQASSGAVGLSSLAVGTNPKDADLKDDNLAFVAGATGKVGSRTVRELLKLGFRVRAGVRSAQRAESLVESVKQIKLDVEGAPPVEKLEIVECDLEKPDQIVPALGNASVVLCCIGASEKEVFDITGPYRIDYQATKNLIDAATVAKVNHFIMVSSLGTNKVGFPAAILNLFWGVLIWKRKAEEALIASSLPYTIVRPGGMERPTDAYKLTHNMTLSEEDTLFGGQVSNLQVAELIAFMAKNRGLSYCKIVEVIAETTAPLTPMDKLLEKIPSKRIAPKEPDATDKPESAPLKTMVPEAPSSPTEKEPVQAKAGVTRPLSPYTVYDDLKPPTSPTPIPPSGQKGSANPVDAVLKPETPDAQTSSSGIAETEQGPVESNTAKPLSPYAAYEDLKPPTSPSPKSPEGKSFNSSPSAQVVSPTTGGSDVAMTPSSNMTSANSPYQVYDDLKPPTSPSLIAPVGSSLSATNGGPKTGNSAPPMAPMGKEVHAELKPRPLSPYFMYEDLKPPTSPTPSPGKLS